jgi:hypothetical protein
MALMQYRLLMLHGIDAVQIVDVNVDGNSKDRIYMNSKIAVGLTVGNVFASYWCFITHFLQCRHLCSINGLCSCRLMSIP